MHVMAASALWLGACGQAQMVGKGDACLRSTECVSGLVCVQGQCSDNLSSIAKQNKVPNIQKPKAAAGNDGG
jgi:hypothetical protein